MNVRRFTARRVARGLATAALVIGVPATTTACGFNVASDMVYQPAEGTNNRDHVVDVLNAVVVSEGGSRGVFVATFSNNDVEKPHNVTGISGEVKASQGKIALQPGGFVNVGNDGGIQVTGDFKPGAYVTITVDVAGIAPFDMDIPVVEPKDHWEEFGTTGGPQPAGEKGSGKSGEQGESSEQGSEAPSDESSPAESESPESAESGTGGGH